MNKETPPLSPPAEHGGRVNIVMDAGEDPARRSALNKLGGRKFAFLLVLTGVLAGFIVIATVWRPVNQMVWDGLKAFFSIYMFIAVAIVAGNVVEKLPIKKQG